MKKTVFDGFCFKEGGMRLIFFWLCQVIPSNFLSGFVGLLDLRCFKSLLQGITV